MISYISSKERAGALDFLTLKGIPVVAQSSPDVDATLGDLLNNDFSTFDMVVVDMPAFVGYEPDENIQNTLLSLLSCTSCRLILIWPGLEESWMQWLMSHGITNVITAEGGADSEAEILAAVSGDGIRGEELKSRFHVMEAISSKPQTRKEKKAEKKKKAKGPKVKLTLKDQMFPYHDQNISINVFGGYPHVGVTFTSLSLFLFLTKQEAKVLLHLPLVNLPELQNDVSGLKASDYGMAYEQSLIVNTDEYLPAVDYDFIIYDRGTDFDKDFGGDVNILMSGIKSWELQAIDVVKKLRAGVKEVALVFNDDDEKKKEALKAKYAQDFKSVSFMCHSCRLSQGTPNGSLFFNILTPEFMQIPGKKKKLFKN